MNYQVVIEGQTIPVPEEIGANDDAVKRALSPFYPEAANAMITRVTKEETVTVTVVKRAGSKGSLASDPYNPVQALRDALPGQNPAIALYEEIEERQAEIAADPALLLELDGRIDLALRLGQEQAQAVEHALKRLRKATPQPAPGIVIGF
jgi:hypothetical protein